MVGAIILAAGASRRMGSPKAALAYRRSGGTETTFLEHLLDVFHRGGAVPIVVVLGHDAETLRERFSFGDALVTVNDNHDQGMLTSIWAGLDALLEANHESVTGVLVCPVDHPEVSPSVVRTLIERFQRTQSPVVLPVHGKKRGHPVLFSREVFDELRRAPETVGARQVVWDHQTELLEVPVKDQGVTVDIDTPDDYRAFRGEVDEH